MSDEDRLLRPFYRYALAVFMVGLVLFLSVLACSGPILTPQLALLVIAAVASETFAFRLRSISVSIGFSLAVAAAVLGGAAVSAVVAVCTFTNLEELRRRRPVAVHAFNFGQLAVVGGLTGAAYVGLGGPTLIAPAGVVVPLTSSEVPGALLALFVAASVGFALNAVLTSVGVHLGRGTRVMEVLGEYTRHAPTQISLAFVGLLMAQVLAINIWAFPLFLFPLFLARQIFQRYASLSDAYLDTVRSLIGALEAKDPYTRGHSERVAEYAVLLARHMGADSGVTERIEKAALLHDIGKLSQSAGLLNKASALSQSEFETMRSHPAVGADMVSRIPPLRSLAPLVGAHHERPDGRGYPDGLLGDEIPWESLILAVTDAYDAMTSSRAYRQALTHEQAVAELIAGAGGQFDREVVRCFIEAGVSRPELGSRGLLRTASMSLAAGGQQ